MRSACASRRVRYSAARRWRDGRGAARGPVGETVTELAERRARRADKARGVLDLHGDAAGLRDRVCDRRRPRGFGGRPSPHFAAKLEPLAASGVATYVQTGDALAAIHHGVCGVRSRRMRSTSGYLRCPGLGRCGICAGAISQGHPETSAIDRSLVKRAVERVPVDGHGAAHPADRGGGDPAAFDPRVHGFRGAARGTRRSPPR